MVFNTFRGTHVILSAEQILCLYNFKNFDENNYDHVLFKNYGLIVNYDEIEALKNINKHSYLTSVLSLTICPTMGCNFDCTYCFEKHKSIKMTEVTQKEIIDFVNRVITSMRIRALSITWFGGEPLLAPDVIDSLSKQLIQIANDKKLKYRASIITNGYFLTQKNADMLAQNKVFKYQITLDGTDKTHNLTRHLANGGPTFEVITKNLQNVKINGIVNIRHNVYNNNKNESTILKKIIENLSKQSGNTIHYYQAIIADNPANYLDNQIEYLNAKDASDIMIERDVNKLIQTRGRFCGSECLTAITIDSEGRLYKCWEDVDKPERSFGNIKTWNPGNPIITADNAKILLNYFNLAGTFDDNECLNCVLLPQCFGGCPSKRLYSHKNCFPYKDYIDDYIQKLVEKFLEKNERI